MGSGAVEDFHAFAPAFHDSGVEEMWATNDVMILKRVNLKPVLNRLVVTFRVPPQTPPAGFLHDRSWGSQASLSLLKLFDVEYVELGDAPCNPLALR